jgi:hypothetical protein
MSYVDVVGIEIRLLGKEFDLSLETSRPAVVSATPHLEQVAAFC